MALFDNGAKLGMGIAIGLGALILVPVLTPVIVAAAKPLAKAGIKGGMLFFEKGKEMISEVAEVVEDLVVEARAELSDMLEPFDNAAPEMAEEVSGDAS